MKAAHLAVDACRELLPADGAPCFARRVFHAHHFDDLGRELGLKLRRGRREGALGASRFRPDRRLAPTPGHGLAVSAMAAPLMRSIRTMLRSPPAGTRH